MLYIKTDIYFGVEEDLQSFKFQTCLTDVVDISLDEFTDFVKQTFKGAYISSHDGMLVVCADRDKNKLGVNIKAFEYDVKTFDKYINDTADAIKEGQRDVKSET